MIAQIFYQSPRFGKPLIIPKYSAQCERGRLRIAGLLRLSWELRLYLTYFFESTFSAAFTKNRALRGGEYSQATAVYHAAIKHAGAALPICGPLRPAPGALRYARVPYLYDAWTSP
jgi:hypothetical protein